MPQQLTIQVLGSLVIMEDGQPISGFRSRTAQALLIYLACQEQSLSRQFLADFFWDERTPKQASANLRAVLSMLRKRLSAYVEIDRYSAGFNHEADYRLDAADFEQALRRLDPLLQSRAPLSEDERRELQDALDLYRGEFLAGYYLSESRGFEEWVLLKRERLRRLASLGLRRLVQSYLECGQFGEGIRYGQQLLDLEPLDEEAHRQMMLLLARTGQRTAALAQYERCRRLLASELNVEPSSRSAALYEQIRAAGAAPLHNLPPDRSPFLGREREMTRIQRQLTDFDCRLLTLLGPGGVGKTRIAVEAARQLVTRSPGIFLHGIRFVALAGLQSGQFLATELADVLDLRLKGPKEADEQLVEHLRNREMLLVLDNFEHLLGEGDEAIELLTTLLRKAPSLKLLVTSRERLGLYEEWLFDLPGLPYPSGDASDLESYSAVDLFVQRARRLRHDFWPTRVELQAVARICRLLDGLPLGIELAASWIRQLDCSAIAGRLEDDLDLSGVGTRDMPARHRSLRAAFEHSWLLLSGEEQKLLRRLSIFQGTFSEAAARQVAGANRALLTALQDKSLLQQGEEGHFGLQPVIRQFLADKLNAEAEESAQTEEAAVTYYATFMAEQEEALRGKQHATARAAIVQELDNVRAIWRLAYLAGNFGAIDRALNALFLFYEKQNWFQEGEALFDLAARHLRREVSGEAQKVVLVRLLVRQGRFGVHLGQYDKARRVLQESMELLPQATARQERGQALAYLGVIANMQGEYALAESLGSESLAIFRAVEDASSIAYCLNLLGNVAQKEGDYARARRLQEENAAIRREIGDVFGVATALNNLGNIAQALEDYEEAKRQYETVYETFKEHNYRLGMAVASTNAGYVAWKQGAFEEAKQLHEESLRIKEALNDRRGIAIAHTNLGEVARSNGEQRQALAHFRQALSWAVSLALSSLAADIFTGMAATFLDSGQAERALTLLTIVQREDAASEEVLVRARALSDEAEERLTPQQSASVREAAAALSWRHAAVQLLQEAEPL